MELKRSKIYKMKGKKESEMTYKEREFMNQLLKEARFGRDEKIILAINMIVLLMVAMLVDSEVSQALSIVLMFIVGMLGIVLWGKKRRTITWG